MNRILIIEDDPVARRQLAQLFRFEDFEVAEAESGDSGIASASKVAPDLVVCDIMMPGTDGFGVLDTLRQRSETALTPFIFLTAKAGGKDIREGMKQGADDYITKPFDPDALLASARQRLARRRLQLEEAERRAAETGITAAAALPREMESCLAHLESLSEALALTCNGNLAAGEIQGRMAAEIARLRSLSIRLRLYGELPNLYGSRFGSGSSTAETASTQIAIEAAGEVTGRWSRSGDLEISSSALTVALPASVLQIAAGELVDNACKFSPAGSRIGLSISHEPECCKIVVSDDGPGMPEEQIRNVGAFKQFWNGAERPGGLGIGLVLVQALVRLHGGEVQIESRPNAGTQVSVLVPTV